MKCGDIVTIDYDDYVATCDGYQIPYDSILQRRESTNSLKCHRYDGILRLFRYIEIDDDLIKVQTIDGSGVEWFDDSDLIFISKGEDI